jgi:exodeoxyribonuclease VII small subunit
MIMTQNAPINKEEIIASIKNMSFEQSMAKLESIVKELESGNGSLENAISGYEIGNALKDHCERKLKEAELRIEKIVQKQDGSISTEQFSE